MCRACLTNRFVDTFSDGVIDLGCAWMELLLEFSRGRSPCCSFSKVSRSFLAALGFRLLGFAMTMLLLRGVLVSLDWPLLRPGDVDVSPAYRSLVAFSGLVVALVDSSRKWSRSLILGSLVCFRRPLAPLGRENLLRGQSLPVPRTFVITAKVASSATP